MFQEAMDCQESKMAFLLNVLILAVMINQKMYFNHFRKYYIDVQRREDSFDSSRVMPDEAERLHLVSTAIAFV